MAHVGMHAPPALRDMRNTVMAGSLVKASIMRSRISIDMLPFSTTHWMPACGSGTQVLEVHHTKSSGAALRHRHSRKPCELVSARQALQQKLKCRLQQLWA